MFMHKLFVYYIYRERGEPNAVIPTFLTFKITTNFITTLSLSLSTNLVVTDWLPEMKDLNKFTNDQ